MQVRRVPVSTKQMDLSELTVKAPKTEQVRTVEASLRLDAIASAGFRVSRAKASDLVKHGDVRCAPSLVFRWPNAVCTSASMLQEECDEVRAQQRLESEQAQAYVCLTTQWHVAASWWHFLPMLVCLLLVPGGDLE